jgi:Rad3-related DNA helicase
VHTTSYPIRNFLQQQLEEYNPAAGHHGRVVTHESADRLKMLEFFKESRLPLVMLSPSFDRGVDLPDNICQCVIICKVPYLSMGDPQVAARMKLSGGQQWYLLKAIQTMIQMSGRAVRSTTDKSHTYILDKQFNALKARTRSIIPGWWLDAIQNMG